MVELSALVVGVHLLRAITASIAEPVLARDIWTVLFVLLVVAIAGCGLPMFWLLQRVSQWNETHTRRHRAPAWLPYWILIVAPLVTGTVVLSMKHGSELGVVGVLLLLCFAAIEGGLWWCNERLWFKPVTHVCLLAGAAGVAVAPWIDTASYASLQAQNGASATVLRLLQRSTDIDADGFSSLFGGGDCAAWDANVYFAARDIADNGVDENCDGDDAKAVNTEVLARFSGHAQELKGRQQPFNVIWIVADAIRADRTSLYDNRRHTTPELQAFAKRSLLFSHATSQSSATMFSIPSMFAGLNPSSMDWEKKQGRLHPSNKQALLASRLKQRGYRTGAVVSDYFTSRIRGVLRGFDTVREYTSFGRRHEVDAESARLTTSFALDLLHQDNFKQPFFLFYYYVGGHHPYKPPASVLLPGDAHDKSALRGYDRELKFLDQHLGLLLDHLRYHQDIWDRTIIIVSSDHGEEFKEHGGTKHAQTCYEESLHVPLIVRIPGMEPKIVDSRVALVDLVPTLEEVMGLEPEGPTDGQSLLVPALSPGMAPDNRPIFCSAISHNSKKAGFFIESVRTNAFTYIRDVLKNTNELYLAADTSQKHNVRTDHPDVAAELDRLLSASRSGNLFEQRLSD